MNIKIMLRGFYLRFWQRCPKIKYKIIIPREFFNKNNSNIPAHKGVDGFPIGASGFTLHKNEKNAFHTSWLCYDKWGNIEKKEYKSWNMI